MGKYLMTEIIHIYDIQSVVFNIILRTKLLGSVTLCLRNVYLRWRREEYVFYQTFVIYR